MQVGSLVRELDAVEVKLAATAKLLSVADPDGFFKAGSAAARSATLSAAQRLAAEKLRADAAAQERRLKQVCLPPLLPFLVRLFHPGMLGMVYVLGPVCKVV